jgi:hypothetical protein
MESKSFELIVALIGISDVAKSKTILSNTIGKIDGKFNGYTLMHYAARYGYNIIDKLLEAGCKIDEVDDYGESALTTAAHHRKFEIVETLVKLGANINYRGKNNHRFPLERAACFNDIKIMKFLLENGAEIDLIDSSKSTALHKASMFGCIDAVKLLLDFGASATIKKYDGETALDVAKRFKRKEVIELLSIHEEKQVPIRYISSNGKEYPKLIVKILPLVDCVFCLKENEQIPKAIKAKICSDKIKMQIFKEDDWILEEKMNVQYYVMIPENSNVKLAYHVLENGDYAKFTEDIDMIVNGITQKLGSIYLD